MRNFQGFAFIWTQTYSEIFKSALADLKMAKRKKVFKFSQNSQENTYARVSFLIKLQVLGKDTLAQAFSCNFCEIFKNTSSYSHLWWLLLTVKQTLKISLCGPFVVIKHKKVDAGVNIWFFKTKKQFWQVKIMSFTFKMLLKNVLQFESVYRRM